MTDAGRVSLPWVRAARYERGNLSVVNKEIRKRLGRKLNKWAPNVPHPERGRHQLCHSNIARNQNNGEWITLRFCDCSILSLLNPPALRLCSAAEDTSGVLILRGETRCYSRLSKSFFSKRNENACVMKCFVLLISLSEITNASWECSHWAICLCLFNNSFSAIIKAPGPIFRLRFSINNSAVFTTIDVST